MMGFMPEMFNFAIGLVVPIPIKPLVPIKRD